MKCSWLVLKGCARSFDPEDVDSYHQWLRYPVYSNKTTQQYGKEADRADWGLVNVTDVSDMIRVLLIVLYMKHA